MRWAVVLAGGVGSRFWPVSTAARPKQLLPLAGEQSLLADAVARVLPMVGPERVLVVTSRSLAGPIRDHLPALPRANVLAEPRAASTAPALAWATAHAARSDPEASVLSLHADWAVGDADGFRRCAARALDVAESEGVLVTVGARPTRAEVGYGYILPSEPLGSAPARRIKRFVEKPTAERAEALIAEGALWNTGLFAWTAARFKEELARHAVELAPGLAALERGEAEAFFDAVTPVSIDVGVLERTTRGAVVEGDFAWDDVGSWAALSRVRSADAAGNVAVGDAQLVDSADCVVWSEDGTTVGYGLSGLVIVRARGITFVTTRERAPELKRLLDRLPPDLAGDRGA